MTMRKVGLFVTGLLLILSVQAALVTIDSTEYHIRLIDPVKQDSAARTYKVILCFDEHRYPATYQLSMRIEVCLEKICKPLELTLFWNALGDYEYLEYPEHLPLTKYNL